MGFWLYVLVGGAAFAFLSFTPPGRRIWAAIMGQVTKGSWWAFKKDPIAIIQREIDNYGVEIENSTGKLEEYNGRKIEAVRRYTEQAQECARLEAKIKGQMNPDGSFKDEKRAGEFAVLLQKAEKELGYRKTRKEDVESKYANTLASINQAKKNIQAKKDNAGRLADDLDMSKVDAATAKLESDLNVRSLNESTLLAEAEKEAQRQIDMNRGRAETRHDLNAGSKQEQEEEEAADNVEAAAILDRFRKPKTEN
jgi:hypothetical protein